MKKKKQSQTLSSEITTSPPYHITIYYWGNNSKRKTLKGRECIVLQRGKMNSCLIEFLDNGQREVVSRNALRKVIEPK